MKKTTLIFFFIFFAILITGCGKKSILDPNNPVTLVLWHQYGEQMKISMDELINEFNNTVGREQGIIVETGLVAGERIINEHLMTAINGDPGAPKLPDIATIYPRMGVLLMEADLLLDLSVLFSEKELSGYIQDFIDYGRLNTDGLYIFPFAKSTEVLFVLTTIFDRFSRDTGITLSHLSTFEGLTDAADKYYLWSGGKSFLHFNDPFNFTVIGFQQMGSDFLEGNRMNFTSPYFNRIWNNFYPMAVQGGISTFEGYGSNYARSGDIVCILGTSAGVIHNPETITYSDNTREASQWIALPYPVFEQGEKVVIQRGAGMCIFKSSKEKEYAAGVFLKWFTEPEQNMRFTRRTGYIPVTEAAYGDLMAQEIINIESPAIRNLYETLIQMRREYRFYVPPVFTEYENIQRDYRSALPRTAANSRREFLNMGGRKNPTAYETVSNGVFQMFINER
jgi:multiple sugar transport system substrate-binding protein